MNNPVFGAHEGKTLKQFRDVMERAERGALMADGHLGYVMPIGGVAAYKNKLSPVGVGFDIGCGNLAARLDCRAAEIDVPKTLDLIQSSISFGIGQKNPGGPQDHALFDDEGWLAYDSRVREKLRQLAREQLGTVGSGNHYVDLFEDENGAAWIGVHFGSRGLGHKTCTGFLNLSFDRPWEAGQAPEKEKLLDLREELGGRYYKAMTLAGRYAHAGREWVVRTLAQRMGVAIAEEIHNHHNYAWEENHLGGKYIVVRKGATPAFPGQRGFVGGSMGDDAVIVEGVDSLESRAALYSTVHGAGRVMSRTQAAGRFKGWGKERKRVSKGLISWPMLNEWLRKKGVALRGGGLDEAPQVYRRLDDVLNVHAATIKILHRLRPLGVVMAGENELDPYRD